VNLRDITRAALSGYLAAVRLPFDLAVGLRGGSAASSSTKRSLDRAEAAIRGIAGWAIGDEQLSDDAQRRRVVAQQSRGHPAPLRGEAQRLSEEGRELIRQRRQEAARRRAQTAKREKLRKRRAAREDFERRRRARPRNRRTVAASDDPAERQRNDRDQALARQEDALAALREAQRLRRAGKAKPSRKPPR
jgi:hypothetical protein